MHNARVYHTLTMLADGTVLAVGGEPTSDQQIVTSGVLPTEIWNPATETWSTAAPIAAARNYHSTAMLMPDGTVLVAGGGHPNGLGDPGQFSAQIYSPPYLFDGPRPTITSAPAASTYNTSITVSTPDAASIGAVNLVSLGADTHQSDMAQHFVPLSFTANSGSLTVQTPANSALAPYGNYMLFIVNKKGVPSVSAPLNLSAAPSAPAAPTGSDGDGGRGQRDGHMDRSIAGNEPDHELHRHPVHRLDGAAADDGHGLSAGDEHDDHRPDERHHLHVHRDRHQRRRHRPRLDGIESRHPVRSHRAGGADWGHRDSGQRERDGDLERSRGQRQPDHELHRHPVHRQRRRSRRRRSRALRRRRAPRSAA